MWRFIAYDGLLAFSKQTEWVYSVPVIQKKRWHHRLHRICHNQVLIQMMNFDLVLPSKKTFVIQIGKPINVKLL